MLTGANVINSEEFIFYIDLTTNFLKKKSVMKAISSFMKEKEKFNALSSYGLVIFQNDDNPISEYDIKDSEAVLTALNNAWESREVNQSFLENGLYEILAYIFRKSRDNRKNYRIIIISDAPSKLDEDYYNALYDLLIKAKKFSAFIDIIRVGEEKFYEDDVKLKVISSETYGGMFYCQDEKLLQNILGSLVQTKKEFKVLNTEDQDQVLKEDKVFYERLAVDLISLSADDEEVCSICEQELCPICEVHSDEVHKCFNCNTKFHSCCAAKYSLARNIGFKHLFRCPQCQTLLKIDEDYVNLVYEEDLEEDITGTEIEEQDLTEIPQQTEFVQEQQYEEQRAEEESYEELSADESTGLPQPPPEVTRKVKVGGFFGKEVEVKINNNLPPVEVTQTIEEESEETVSITTLKPPRKRGTATIKLCKICGATLQNTKNCPMCGARTD
ncbi:MAG: vWA domain-containing protein [Promethearchaeota archaeon]|jgi:hypothetical protein